MIETPAAEFRWLFRFATVGAMATVLHLSISVSLDRFRGVALSLVPGLPVGLKLASAAVAFPIISYFASRFWIY